MGGYDVEIPQTHSNSCTLCHRRGERPDLGTCPGLSLACSPPVLTLLVCRCGSHRHVTAEQAGSCGRMNKEVRCHGVNGE